MQREQITVGLIEDDPVMGGSIVQRLELEGCAVKWWLRGGDALSAGTGGSNAVDLMVCDMRLPDMDGEEVYRQFSEKPDAPPFMFITGYGDIDQAVRLMRMGAADYMTKPFQFDEFLRRIEASTGPADKAGGAPGTVLGVSPAMRRVEDMVHRYAGSDMPVLITGETGVGKEVAARLMHGVGARASLPFMAVNCAAIPPELLESEIFGHEKGAFTGAVRRHAGYAERAGGGTLFLDEIGDMPPVLQVKILRLVEDRRFVRIGGEHDLPFRARVVAATHKDLSRKETRGDFREDLYFRLAVLPLDIPPLRKRRDDIPSLMDRLLADAADRQRRTDVRGFSAHAEEAALDHDWPGNVRELRNRIERAVALAGEGWLMPADLFPEKMAKASAGGFAPLSEIRDAAERRQIERALAETTGHIRNAATLLGISRTTLWEKMTRLGISADDRSDS
jgi:DNA-binding NtrC family response regulator